MSIKRKIALLSGLPMFGFLGFFIFNLFSSFTYYRVASDSESHIKMSALITEFVGTLQVERGLFPDIASYIQMIGEIDEDN